MPQYIAFLRAINVGGRFIKMAALAEHFRSLGHGNVSTCIHSGNVIFYSGSKSPERLAAALQRLHSGIDDFAHGGTELFWICHRKQSASKFSNAVLERKLRLVTTIRRVGMLETLAAELAAGEHG